MDNQDIKDRHKHQDKELKQQDITEQKYLNNDNYVKALVENALDIIMVLDCSGNIRFINNSAKAFLGKEPEVVVGENIIEYIHPEEKDKFQSHFISLVKGKTETDFSHFQFLDEVGDIKMIESRSKKVKDSDEEFCIVINARDITEQAKMQDILEKSQEQLALAQKISQVGSWEWDLEYGVVRWSKEMHRIYGRKVGKPITDYEGFLKFLHPGDREHFTVMLQRALKNRNMLEVEYRIKRPDGVERKMHAKGEVVCNEKNEPIKIIATAQDITEFKQAEHQLLKYSEQLKSYNAKQDQIIENERVQIARDIHDELGQMLTVLKMDVFLLKERAKEEIGKKRADKFSDETKGIFKKFDSLINSVQKITKNLRPEEIDDLGFVEALKWQCSDFEEITGIKCNFVCEAENLHDMIKEYKNVIFRIVQQALSNIGEHAEATKAKVKLKVNENYLTLKIWDNGTGIKKENTDHPNSMGLLSMRERSHYLGGNISFTGKKGEGTTVFLEIPLDEIIFKY